MEGAEEEETKGVRKHVTCGCRGRDETGAGWNTELEGVRIKGPAWRAGHFLCPVMSDWLYLGYTDVSAERWYRPFQLLLASFIWLNSFD